MSDSSTSAIPKHQRHWSFVVCDPKYLFPLVGLILVLGIIAGAILKDSTQVSRVGNFIIGTGVWMTMRYTFREGIKRNKNLLDSSPTIPSTSKAQLVNANFFNNINFSIGDAHLQIKGFIIIIIGSVLGSYGDIIFSFLNE